MNGPNDTAEKQGGIPQPTAPLHFVANGLALPSFPKTSGANNISLTAVDVMKLVAFPADDCNNKSLQRRVLCQKNKMLAEAMPSTVELNQDSPTTSISPLTPASVYIIADWVARQYSLTLTPEDIISALAAKQQQRDSREDCSDKATSTTTNTVAINTTSENAPSIMPSNEATDTPSNAHRSNCNGNSSKRGSLAVARKSRTNMEKLCQNATQINCLNATREEQKEPHLQGVVAGIKMHQNHQSGTCIFHKSGEDKANYVSRLHGTNVTIGTIRYHIWRQNTLQHDLIEPSSGRSSKLSLMVEDARVTAMETHSNLMSSEMKKKPNRQDQIQDYYVSLYCQLSAKYAVEVEISTKNSQLEEQQGVWTTSNKINTWFESLRDIFLNRILNINETALTLDGTSTNAGGCPVTDYGLSNKSYHRVALRSRRAVGDVLRLLEVLQLEIIFHHTSS
eukprot:jgi/Psemu1/27454/gm1.27454_g